MEADHRTRSMRGIVHMSSMLCRTGCIPAGMGFRPSGKKPNRASDDSLPAIQPRRTDVPDQSGRGTSHSALTGTASIFGPNGSVCGPRCPPGRCRLRASAPMMLAAIPASTNAIFGVVAHVVAVWSLLAAAVGRG